MPVTFGTRIKDSLRFERIDQGQQTRTLYRDPGMSKFLIGVSVTFVAGTSRITAANGVFANFAPEDEILVEGTNLNNGYKTVTATDAVNQAFLIVDPPPANEGPITTAIIRTP
jgi:hypothetical protein